ncbi:kelch repeat-containing protein [Candidatus Zixiibacteriota bacterium]
MMGCRAFRISPRSIVALMLFVVLGGLSNPIDAQDTTPPQWIAASGSAGDTTITFWFDEPVDSTSAVTTTNFSLTGGLTIDWIRAIGSNSGSWSTGTSMTTQRYSPAVGILNDSIYVAGGTDNSPTLEAFDPTTATWTAKSPMPTPSYPSAWGVINTKFYLAGGSIDGSTTDSLFIYDPATDAWVHGALMQVPRYWGAGGVINGKLYVVGGYSAFQGFENTLEIYDPGTDSWSYGSSMPTAREAPVAGVIDGKLYVAGGANNSGILDVLEVYDPTTDSWMILSSMPGPRREAAGAAIHGQLFVLGGSYDSIIRDTVFRYDPMSDQWSTEDPTPTARSITSAIGYNSKIFNLGGDDGTAWSDALEIYDLPPQVFRLGLGTGNVLPNSATPVTLTASNITDLNSNTIPAPIDTTFLPTTGGDPAVDLRTPAGGVQSTDVKIPFQITDAEGNPVTLSAEYSTDGSIWTTATVTGTLIDIPTSGYQDSLIWHSGTDLSGQALEVRFKLTPRDNAVSTGIADSISFSIDNKPPEWVAASGVAGDTIITFWFDELVEASTATNTNNISLSNGLTISQITNGGSPLDQWSGLTVPIPLARNEAFGGVVDDRFYVIGGESGGTTYSRVDIFDPQTETWSSGASMPTARQAGASAIVGNKIYAIGGFLSSGQYTNLIEIYDPVADSWSSGTSMPSPRQGFVAGAIDGLIYVVDGDNALGWVSTLEIYDPVTDSWTSGTAKPRQSTGGGAAVLDGKLYVFGGHDGPPNNYLEVYDPKTDTWTELSSMATNRQGVAGSVWDGKIYATGGGDNQIWNTTEVYDPDTDTWGNGPSFDIGRGSHLSGIIRGSLYLVAGNAATGGDIQTIEELPFLPNRFLAELADGDYLPSSSTAVTLTASNIADVNGNAVSTLDSVFTPSTGDVPEITVTGPSGTSGGNISIIFQITDAENNPVSLVTSYSTDGSTWSSATVTGTTTNIPFTAYQDTLIWQSATDLPGQEFDQIWFKVTPSDNASTSGVPDSISFGLDNKPPEWIAATGTAGDTTITFWFDELVETSTAYDQDTYSLSEGLVVSNVVASGGAIGEWTSRNSLPEDGSLAAGGVVDGKLYVVNQTTQEYDPQSDSWSIKTQIPTIRYDAAASVIDGLLYILGGHDGTVDQISFNTVEVYDPATDSWSTRASMQESRYGPWSAAINGKLYVGGDKITCEVYDPATDSWSYFTQPPEGTHYSATAVINGHLYLYQPWVNGQFNFYMYDPISDNWVTLASPLSSPGNAVAGQVLGEFYLLGQEGELQIYNPHANSWTTGTSIPTARGRPVIGTIKGKLYVAGGGFGDGFQKLEALSVVPDQFRIHLLDTQVLPFTSITLQATGISDLYGNVAATLDTVFTPSTGNAPSVTLSGVSGIESGDIPIHFQITDDENNPVSLTAGYSSDGGLSWQSATITGTTTDIPYTSYQDTLIWQSATDLPGQEFDQIWFKVTPSDNATTSGVPDSISFGLDNKPPEWIAAEGVAGDTTITFWFDELVGTSSGLNANNFSLSDGLIIESISFYQSWVEAAPMPTARPFAASAVVDDLIYVINGTSALDWRVLEVFNPETQSWSVKTPMNVDMGAPVAGVINGKIYVAGGNHGLAIYDPLLDSWEHPSSGPHWWYPAGGVVNDKFYFIGGQDPNGSDEVYEYDPIADNWTLVSPIPTARYGATAEEIENKLYVVGGGNQFDALLSTLEVYDPFSDEWNTKTPMPVPVRYAASTVYNNKLYVIGGIKSSEEFSESIFIYDPITDTWVSGGGLPGGRYGATAQTVGKQIFIAGGFNGIESNPEGGNMDRLDIFTPQSGFIADLTSGQTLPFAQITLQATGISDLYGNTASTLSADFVPTDENENPVISIDSITEEMSGDVTLSYTITDPEGDACELSPRYSIDGGNTWFATSTTSDTSAISADSYAGSLVWSSNADLPHYEQSDVLVRITVRDNDIEPGTSDEISFHLDNNEVPVVDISDAVLAVSDTSWAFHYSLSDAESDTLTMAAEYSSDDGTSWHQSTITGNISNITSSAYSDSLKWMAGRDLPGVTQEVLFRIIPSDRDEGTADTETVFVNSLGVPTVDITSDLSSEQSGDVTIAYTADDINSDPLDLVFEYEYPADAWNTATVTGSASLAGPAEYNGSVVWHSGTDLPGLDIAGVSFRIIPSDTENAGLGESVSLHVDNNEPPSLSLTSPSGTLGRNIQVDCQLTDTESDTLEITGWWSHDRGVSWQAMTFDGSQSGLLSAQYSRTITWRSFDDCGYGEIDSVLVKLVPADHDQGSEAISDYFTVTNYVGDYNGDVLVDFSDFATLVTAWNSQDTYHDIGPATGAVPDLVPASDGVIDFEDLTVYLQMWSWSAAVNAGAMAEEVPSLARASVEQTDRHAPVMVDRRHPITLEQPEPDDLWAPDSGLLDLNLEARDVAGLTSAGFIIHYDTQHLALLDVQPGTFLGRAGGQDETLVAIKRIDEELGRIELMYGRLDELEPEVSGSGRLASLQFRKLSEENSTLDIRYDLRNGHAERLVSDQYQTSVTARWIPTDFALMQNYPNPFNGETIIRFQLPAERKVQLYIYNIRGQRVATVVDRQMEAGYHRVTWNGLNDDGRQVSSGIYIYLIQAGPHRQSKKLTYIK